MNSDLYDSEHLSLLSEVPYYLELICLSLIDIVATWLCLLDIKFVVLKLVWHSHFFFSGQCVWHIFLLAFISFDHILLERLDHNLWSEDLAKTTMVDTIIFLFYSLLFISLITFSFQSWIIRLLSFVICVLGHLIKSSMFGTRYIIVSWRKSYLSNIYSQSSSEVPS